jgi:hypothetical protein
MSEFEMTPRQRIVATLLGGAFVLGVANLGCQRTSSTQSKQTDTRPAAEKSFDEIAQIVKSALETGGVGMQGGFVDNKGNARSQFSVHNDVTSEIIPPTDGSEAYRAKITVKSRTTYSLRRIPDSEKKNSDQDNKKKSSGQDSGANPPDDTPQTGPNGVEVLDQDLVTPSKGKSLPGGQPDDAVSRLADEESRTYDLAYESGHWVLKSELDPKTEQSVSNAFKYALSLQP